MPASASSLSTSRASKVWAPGILVTWWPIPGGFTRAATAAHQRFLRARLADWLGAAGLDRPEKYWPRRWAEAYVAIRRRREAAVALSARVRFFPWSLGRGAAAMGDRSRQFGTVLSSDMGHRSGSGETFRAARARGSLARPHQLQIQASPRDRAITQTNEIVEGVCGAVLEPTNAERGKPSSRTKIGDLTLRAQAVIVASGGIGGNHGLVAAIGRRGSDHRRER